MDALSTYHGIPIPRECVNSGFNWRTGGLDPSLSDTFNNFCLRKTDLGLLQESLLTIYKAGLRHPGIPIPCRIRDFIQEVNRSQAPASIPSAISSHSNMEMSPDFLQNCFALRN
jgi:hypothetical protein